MINNYMNADNPNHTIPIFSISHCRGILKTKNSFAYPEHWPNHLLEFGCKMSCYFHGGG